ncbi:EamA family transporter RarD, partial [Aeromonas veronii]
LLLMGCAPATVVAVGLFCFAVARTLLSSVGLVQFIEPSLGFLLAIDWFGDAPDPLKAVGLGFVWAGLLVCL